MLPHVGTRVQGLDHVGLTYMDGSLFVHATDKYTLAIARVDDAPSTICTALPVKEATELMRFVRPNRVGERTTEVSAATFAVEGYESAEFHVGFDNLDGEFESEVYETCEPKLPLDSQLAWLRRLNDRPDDTDNLIVQPKLLEKFAKAAREDGDRLWILSRQVDEVHGAAVVACGQNFVGAIAGLTYDDLGEATLASFLTDQKAAA